MVELKEGLVLYHGSYCQIEEPLLEKCAMGKDFGRGFYLTSSKEQAIRFLNTSLAKAKALGDVADSQNYGVVSTFKLKNLNGVKNYVYEDANIDWLHCIAAHRKKGIFQGVAEAMSGYDIIVGKIADDATNATLTAYLAGAFGIVGEAGTDELCIKQLLPNKLQDQLCFRTEKALGCLEFIEGEKIWLNQ